MNGAFAVFRSNLDRVRALHTLHLNLLGLVAPIIDLSDLLRAEIVLIVSALDHYIHEITRIGMLEIWQGTRAATQPYLRFPVSLNLTTQLAQTGGGNAFLETEIRTRQSYHSFQQPDQIADAIRLISQVELWNEIAQALKEQPQDVKARLKLLVERRNKIAHEADIDPTYPGQRWPISRNDVDDALTFVAQVGETIFNLVA